MQLLTTVAVADVDVLAFRLPAGHGVPLLLRHRMKGLAVKVEEYEPTAAVCWEPKSRAYTVTGVVLFWGTLTVTPAVS